MTESNQYIAELIGKYLEDRLTAEEHQDLENWLNAAGSNRGLLAEITDQQKLAVNLQKFYSYDSERISQKIGEAIPEFRKAPVVTPHIPSVHRVHFLRKWGWAAAALLLVAGGAYYLVVDKNSAAPVAAVPKATEVAPGKDGAILTLADGRQVVLDSLGNGIVAQQSGADVVLNNGRLVYDAAGQASAEILYNTMTTPKGRQFQVTLPDGTRVWLNAASSIRFPTIFAGTERRVEITGEVYFEVAQHSAKPFRVNVSGAAEIDVLGTSFNINAYENEKTINTTLLNGSIRIADVLLRPGQQARVQHGMAGQSTAEGDITRRGVTVTNDVDIDKVMAWKNGLFNFEESSLEEVMRQLERWYDIEVVYENGVPKTRFWGEMQRQTQLPDLLEILRKTEVEFRMEGRRLIVLNK
ncbi:MAG: DUF4974 domain-containing protein [Candidatus Pseudobacter hemicellulosilyticus]|uniref:DUF4974 domain-containing protein n=1 Tax=Candidatus Pseudobacter hemicellulosilyticus TaxID=3121375 RepID=A0AAJ6BHR6_9BACT|nr:MAG: DUF4974 domain-containing protein [Pseudobacter sp.]